MTAPAERNGVRNPPRWEKVWTVRCFTCRKYGTNNPHTVRECCPSCADATAHAHRILGHEVEILAPKWERAHESSTVRRLTGNRGW